MTTIIAVDPGDKLSALLHYDPLNKAVLSSHYLDNAAILAWLRLFDRTNAAMVIEMISSYGMPVGREVFETCVWIGRFIEAWHAYNTHMVYRRDVKLHLCGSARAKDGNIRQSLLDKFGGARARGTKRQPGPLYGISSHKWSALAVAVTWSEEREVK